MMSSFQCTEEANGRSCVPIHTQRAALARVPGAGRPAGVGGHPGPRGRDRGGHHPGAGQDALPEGGGEGGGHLLPAEVLPRHAHRAAHPVLAPAEDAVHAPPDGPTARRSHGRGPPTPGVDPV